MGHSTVREYEVIITIKNFHKMGKKKKLNTNLPKLALSLLNHVNITGLPPPKNQTLFKVNIKFFNCLIK